MDNSLRNGSQNIRYLMHNWWRWDRRGTVLAFLRIPVAILIPTITALIPKMMVDMITAQAPLRQFVLTLAGLSLLAALFSWLEPALDEKLEAFQLNISMHYAVELFDKLLCMDYENLESYEGRSKFERCRKFAFDGPQADGAWAAVRLTGLCTGVLGIATYLTLVSFVSPWLMLLILAMCAVEFVTYQAAGSIAVKTEDQMVRGEMRFYYFYRLATDPGAGKDIRLCGAADWLLWHLARAAAAYQRIMRWFTRQTTMLTAVQALCALIRDAATFAFLIFAVLRGQMEIGSFLFYFGLIAGFSGWINGISGHITSLRRISVECQKYRDFIEMPDHMASGRPTPVFSHVDKIEFRNVSFAYHEGEPVLKNISFTIRSGEKIAVVGENGAGKTTLIKLLCGLYRPSSGQILLNDTDISQFDREAYYDLFSAVFQDYTFLPASLLENIAVSETADEGRVREALGKAGLLDKVDSLREGIYAKLIKQVNAGAVDLSGGEKQRLLLARALYKDAPVLILDEPTAALDPIAEERLYLQYHELTNRKLSFYISHRLTSTRFCDRIFFLRGGEITETGSHEQLLSRRGDYWRMYQVQGFYYRKGADI